MSSSEAFQNLVEATLLAAPGVAALVGDRVYEVAPPADRRKYPDVTFGPSDGTDEDADCIDGEEHVLQVDIWDRNFGRKSRLKRVVDAVRSVLHKSELELPDPYALALIEVSRVRILDDPDGITVHGVVSVRAIIETYA